MKIKVTGKRKYPRADAPDVTGNLMPQINGNSGRPISRAGMELMSRSLPFRFLKKIRSSSVL